MDLKQLEQLIEAHKRDELDGHEAARQIRDLFYEDLGYAR